MKKNILGLIMILSVSCTQNPGTGVTETPKPTNSPAVISEPTSGPTVAPTIAATSAPDAFDTERDYRVEMQTSMGTIKLKLFPKEAPKTVENFTGLITKKYYDGLIFHRVMSDFMIQGGDPLGTGFGGQSFFGKPFVDEFSPNLSFTKKGQLAMANTGPNSNGSQFFITLKATTWLNNAHTIFGEVTEGLNVLEAIGNIQTGANDKPLKDVVMTRVTVSQ